MQNEGDRIHACIECIAEEKSGPIYVPKQWIPVIHWTEKSGTLYKVFKMAS